MIRNLIGLFAHRMRKVLVGQSLRKGIALLSKMGDVNLLQVAYENMGIMKYQNSLVSGEKYFIKNVLSRYIFGENPILFDVGANKGLYSLTLRTQHPTAKIFAFEPNRNSFKILETNLRGYNIDCFQLGFGSTEGRGTLFTYANDLSSEHASMYREVFIDFYGTNDLLSLEFEIKTIDKFCFNRGIQYIDFMKVDTEGHELEVLKGAATLISKDAIGIIQFEFNETNVLSRVFLRDFYRLLEGYNIYRLDTNRLLPLYCYSSENEIFRFQNFVAFNKLRFRGLNPEEVGQ